MRKPLFFLLALILFCSHDLYLRMESYFLQPDQEATIMLYNGTFEKSENIITRDRIQDASMVSNGKRVAIDSSRWTDQDSTITKLNFNTGNAGTYVVGVSTKARNIELSAEDFNDYLDHDGVLDMLEKRRKDSILDQDAVESYQKHVKAIYQVGDVKTDDWKTVLGYPIEFVPQENPYEKYSGNNLKVQLLLDGDPLANQLVYADYITGSHSHTHGDQDGEHTHDETTHSHDHEHGDDQQSHSHDSGDGEEHTHTSGQQLRTDNNGVVTVDLSHDGIYYLRTIHMVEVSDSEELTHMSKWATLTFEVTHDHSSEEHEHHADEEGIPTWIFVVGSALLVGVLFLVFRKKN